MCKLALGSSCKAEIASIFLTLRLEAMQLDSIASSKSTPLASTPFSLSNSSHSPLPQPKSIAFKFG